MTPPLDSTDKKIVALSALILMISTVLALYFAPGSDSSATGFPSSYSSAGDGAKAAYMLLGESGYRVERWVNPPEDLPTPAKDVVLIIAGPIVPFSEEEARQIKQFVSRGGRLLITGWMGAVMLGGRGVQFTASRGDDWQTFAAEAPSPVTQHAPEILMQSSARWAYLESGQARYYGTNAGAVVTKLRFGQGEIIWWASDSPLTNYGITKASNLALFLNCLGYPGQTRVLWDEYFHGVRRSLWHYLSHTPLPWALLQVTILAAFVVFTYARRSGAVRPLRRDSRLSPLEFVDTIGELYERKGAAAGALEIGFARFRFLLARRLGMPSATKIADLIHSLKDRPGWMVPGFAETLEQIDSALKLQQVTEPMAVAWTGKLYDFAQKMGLER